MNNLEKLASLRQETAALCARIMGTTESEIEFAEAFRIRDVNYVESMFDGMTEDERAEAEGEMRWETGCGCNGNDSAFHTYFGMGGSDGGYDYYGENPVYDEEEIEE